MACAHKFESYLNLEKLDFEPTTLIVGTFNPTWPVDNKADWFYGRIENNFWDVLPRLYGEKSLRGASPLDCKAFCKRHKIAITDLISSIDDAEESNKEHQTVLKSFSDKSIAEKFKEHSTVKIADLLEKHKSIKNIYLTRGISSSFWKKLWKPVELYTLNKALHERKLLTSSGYAYFQQGRYNKNNPMNPLKLEDFILKDWQSKWHF